METQGITTEKAPRLAPEGLKSVGTSTDGPDNTASVESCQEVTPAAVAAWFTTHRDRFIPARAKGFSYKREESAWVIQKNTETALADIIAKGAVYRTTCGSQTEPLAADEENKDRKNLATLRYGHFTWDFDAPGDVEKARNAAVTLVHELLPALGVQPSQVYCWLSGSKGFHVDIPDVCIGSEAGDRLLPLIYQRMAAEIAGEKITYDTSMYCMGKGKQYRLPNVKRSNGLHKIALTADELKSMSIEDMQELAKKPRLLPLAPLTKTPDDAPIREMYQRHKEGVWHDELKPKRPPLTLDDKERFAGKQFACMKYMAEEQEGYAGVAAANVNAYCAMLIAPEQEFFKRDTEDTEDLYGDCIMRCAESGSYPTPEDRLDKLRAEIRIKNIRPWSCGAAHKYLPKEALKCGDCIYKQLEAESAFAGSQIDTGVFDESGQEERRQKAMQADALVDDGTGCCDDEAPKPFSFDKFRLGSYLATKPKPVKWILKDSFKLGTLGFIAGPQGGGKTHFLTQLGAAVASGDSRFIGGVFDIGEKGEVLYVSAEDDYDTIHSRTWRVFDTVLNPFDDSDALAESVRTDLNHNFIIYPVFGDTPEFTKKAEGNITMTGRFIAFQNIVKELTNLKLIILDPLSRFNGCDENDNHASTVFCSLLERIIKDTGVSIILAHHVSKGFSQTTSGSFDMDKALHMDALRGASGLSGAARWQMNFVPLPFKVARQELKCKSTVDGQYVACKVSKNNHAELAPPFFLHRGAGGMLQPAQVEYSADATALGALIRARIIEEVSRISEAGEQPLTKKALGDTRPAMWKAEIPKVTKARVLAEAEELLRLGELVEVERMGGNHKLNLYLELPKTGQA